MDPCFLPDLSSTFSLWTTYASSYSEKCLCGDQLNSEGYMAKVLKGPFLSLTETSWVRLGI